MKRYRTKTIVTINSGNIGLSKKQAESRSHLLTDIGKGVYLLKGQIQLKAGEEIAIDVVDNAMASALEPIDHITILARDIPGKKSNK